MRPRRTVYDVGHGGRMSLDELVAELAPWKDPILLLGPPGVGKTTLARAIHEASGRRGAFRALSVGETPPTLFAARLYGCRAGAFTGAVHEVGLVAEAHGGTLFVDEIGDLPPTEQGALHHLLDEQRYRPLGGAEARADVRVILATCQPRERLRPDLLDRFAGTIVEVPAPSDQQLRAALDACVATYASEHARRPLPLAPEAREALVVVGLREGSFRGATGLARHGFRRAFAAGASRIGLEHVELPAAPSPRRVAREVALARALATADSVTEAARRSGIPRSTLYRWRRGLG